MRTPSLRARQAAGRPRGTVSYAARDDPTGGEAPVRCPLTMLWRSVVVAAIQDATGQGSGYGGAGERERAIAEARAWLEAGGP